MFPIKRYRHRLPYSFESSAGFGFSQKDGKHQSGVDLYCAENQEIFAIEESDVVDMFISTGENAGSSWFNNTYTLLLEGNSGVINYSGIIIDQNIKFGKPIKEGQLIGGVKQIMNGVSVPTLHIELYQNGTQEPIIWHRGETKPADLIDPSDMLRYELSKTVFRY